VIEAYFRNLSISDLTAKLIIAGLDPGSRAPHPKGGSVDDCEHP